MHIIGMIKRIFKKRNSGGSGFMVWAGFSGEGQTEICFVDGKLNSQYYITILEEYLLSYPYSYHGTETDDFMLIQDGATHHRSCATRNWLQQLGVTVINWPSVSPD